jgi:hypothetical protein
MDISGAGDREAGKINSKNTSITFDDLHGTCMVNLLLSRVWGEYTVEDIWLPLEWK